MKTSKVVFGALCGLLLSQAYGQQAVQQQGTQLPAQAVAGYWATDAKFESRIASKTKQEYWWVGKMWGRIDPTGKMQFEAANGCAVSGLLAPSGTQWQGTAMVTGCQNQDMSGKYSLYVSGGTGQPHMSLRLTSSRSQPSLATDTYEVSGTFSRYSP